MMTTMTTVADVDKFVSKPDRRVSMVQPVDSACCVGQFVGAVALVRSSRDKDTHSTRPPTRLL